MTIKITYKGIRRRVETAMHAREARNQVAAEAIIAKITDQRTTVRSTVRSRREAGQGMVQRQTMGWRWMQDWSDGTLPRATRKGSSSPDKKRPDNWKRHRQTQWRCA